MKRMKKLVQILITSGGYVGAQKRANLKEVHEATQESYKRNGYSELSAPCLPHSNSYDNIICQTHTYINKYFKSWKFGTVNIRSGKEKDEGSKIYGIEVAKLNLTFCCLQEVKYRNIGKKLVELGSREI